ncbi:MAG: ABC transporter permease, partial [Gemmatimonadota bacterium]
GVGLPFVAHGAVAGTGPALPILLVVGVLLTFVFTSLAFAAAVRFDDRAKGLGLALLAWFGCTVLYDGFILFVASAFTDYPLETPMLVLILANPVDLGRMLLLLTLDAAALMGYTGAVFERFFGSGLGVLAAVAALLVWATVPWLLGVRGFSRKDF